MNKNVKEALTVARLADCLYKSVSGELWAVTPLSSLPSAPDSHVSGSTPPSTLPLSIHCESYFVFLWRHFESNIGKAPYALVVGREDFISDDNKLKTESYDNQIYCEIFYISASRKFVAL